MSTSQQSVPISNTSRSTADWRPFGLSHQARPGEPTKQITLSIMDYYCENGGRPYRHRQCPSSGPGEWMAKRKNHDEIILAAKYTKPMRLSLERSLECSLSNLQTSYIDLFYVHYWDYTTSIPELMHANNDLVSSGKVNYLGISNAPVWVVTKANHFAHDQGLRHFIIYQETWNAAMRDFERDMVF